MRFSERQGIIKPKVNLQINSVDQSLKNRLWNAINEHYVEPFRNGDIDTEEMGLFLKKFWGDFLKQVNDSIDIEDDSIVDNALSTLKQYFFKECSWNEIYDIIDHLATHYPDSDRNAEFIKHCNLILESELSGYRFTGNQLCPISSELEINEIEEAIQSPLKSVNIHLKQAVKLFSDRESPDYRNSIKESISAVEAICKLIANNQRTTLGDALNIIEREGKIKLHESLKKGFASLYSYTNDSDGIRHAIKDDTINASFDEAKFMLVTCSSFVNYLLAKAIKAKIPLEVKNKKA